MSPRLTPKQACFAAEYLVDLNATRAAIRAGYSEKTAASQGERLLRNVEILKAVAKAREERAAKLERTALDVLKDIQAATKAASESGDLKTALRGLELEGKHYGMFLDRVHQSGDMSIRVELPQEAEE